MLEKDISRLNARDRVNLDELESDVWRRERHVQALQAAGRLLASWQGFVLALAVVISAATGAALAAHVSQPAAFIAEENLAPSHLLLGSQR